MSTQIGNKGNFPQKFAACTTESFSLNEDVLRHILLNNGLGDIKVYVISIIGPSRSGKSFLLNFFVRYFHRRITDNWLGEESEPLSGFLWRGGSEGITKGMWIWPEVFLLDTTHGEKVGVVLVDTQGAFDRNGSKTEDALLFSVTALTSSVLIYNVRNDIDEKALENLMEFLTCTSEEFLPCTKIQLGKILFLVRDWGYVDEHASGTDGGQEYLHTILEDYNENNEDACYVRRYIKDMYKDIACFLVTHPGIKATRAKFDGKLADLEEAFVDDVRSLTTYLFGQGDAHCGRGTCQELFQLYISFNGKKIANIKDFMTLTMDLKLSDISMNARLLYNPVFKPSAGMPMVIKEHRDNWMNVLTYFNEQTVGFKVERAKLFKNKLHKEVADVFFQALLNAAEMEYKRILECCLHAAYEDSKTKNRYLDSKERSLETSATGNGHLEVLVDEHARAKEIIECSMNMASDVGESEQYEKACLDLYKRMEIILGGKLTNVAVTEYRTRLKTCFVDLGPSVTIANLCHAHRAIFREEEAKLMKFAVDLTDEYVISAWTNKINRIFCERLLHVSIGEYESIMNRSKDLMANSSDNSLLLLLHQNAEDEVKRKFAEAISDKSQDASDIYLEELKEKMKARLQDMVLDNVIAFYKRKMKEQVGYASLLISGKLDAIFSTLKVKIREDLKRLFPGIAEGDLQTCYNKTVEAVRETYKDNVGFGEKLQTAIVVTGCAAGTAGVVSAARNPGLLLDTFASISSYSINRLSVWPK